MEAKSKVLRLIFAQCMLDAMNVCLPPPFFVTQGSTLTFFPHSTGATEVESFVAQATKIVAEYKTSVTIKTTSSSDVRHFNRHVTGKGH